MLVRSTNQPSPPALPTPRPPPGPPPRPPTGPARPGPPPARVVEHVAGEVHGAHVDRLGRDVHAEVVGRRERAREVRTWRRRGIQVRAATPAHELEHARAGRDGARGLGPLVEVRVAGEEEE